VFARLSLTARVGLGLIVLAAAWFGGWLLMCLSDERQAHVLDQVLGSFMLCFFLGPVGCFMLIRSTLMGREEEFDAVLRANSLTTTGPARLAPLTALTDPQRLRIARPWRALRVPSSNRPLFPRPSTIGLITVLVFLPFALPRFFILGSHRAPVGLMIHVLRPGTVFQTLPTGMQSLRVSISLSGPGKPPTFFVNSRQISQRELGVVLRSEIELRPPSWPVYVDGDPALEWHHIADAIDTIRGLGAEVVLLKR
jgi:hypothetical protein